MNKDYFAQKAGGYEQNQNRVDNVQNIADAIISSVSLNKSMHLLDFGSGTGLLLERIARHVAMITALDVSQAMNRQLEAKLPALAKLGCDVQIVALDLSHSDFQQTFDGIISSMTMHHIENIEAMFAKLYALLHTGGFIAIADLDKEDGSFHTEDTGVFHSGFDRKEIIDIAAKVGFKRINIETVSVVHKQQGDFPVFLLTALK